MWEYSTKPKYVKILMNNQNIMFGLPPPYGKTQKLEKCQTIYFDECWNNFFGWTPFYIENIIYLAKILRALLSNKMVFLHFCKKSIIK